jgi:CheY-like chemotaxis protein/anti-sigma regulatory factor (Ser/Thr protein kinase)
VLSTATGLLKDKSLQLRPDYPEDLPLVWADPIRVRQICLNLLSNAIKFTNSGSVTLRAEVVGDWVAISVIDTGIGIPEEGRSAIFDRFGQISSGMITQTEGTGLGLDISKHLSRMHGGDLNVQSQVGKGSQFTFTLPIATSEQLEMNNFANDEVFSILLVEDEMSMRDLLRRALELAGYLVIDTHDGALVMELALGLLPSVIILDVNLPNTSGWEVITQLKNTPETAAIPIIVYTASSDRQRALELGASQFIAKPTTPDDVIKAVREHLADWETQT